MGESPDRSRTPLLELVTREAIDQDYVVVAARTRAAGGVVGSPSHRVAAAGLALFGLLVAVAAVQTSRNSEVDEASREALIERIETRRAAVAGLRERTATLRASNASQVDALLRVTRVLASAESQLAVVGLDSGFAPVSGPGLRVTVDDSDDGSDDGRVRDTDLRLLVNGLWHAGAEAIAINGRRLTAVSGIVNADIAIQVNKGPLSPPYVVEAIGGPDLAADLLDSGTGIAFFALAREFGFEVTRENVERLDLRGASAGLRRITYATRDQGPRPPDQEENAP